MAHRLTRISYTRRPPASQELNRAIPDDDVFDPTIDENHVADMGDGRLPEDEKVEGKWQP